ncbi:MAG: hypothetical protein NTV86_08985 [Planctomycetota bacterium]|nr:hypothetical protein [Planctomycetota bacterium]
MIRILWCSVVVAVLAPPADAQPASAPGDLTKAIEIIRTSQTPADITDAYRVAREKSPDSIELHRTYMIRMLKYGVIVPAQGAAERLVALDPTDGLAWAVKAYVDGKAGRFPQALEHAFQAAKSQGENPSVLTALGQLTAWHENTPKCPELSAEAKAILAAHGAKLKARAPFAAAYAALTKAYADAGERRKTLEARLDDVHKDMKAADADYRALGGQVDNANRQIATVNRHEAGTRQALYNLLHQTDAPSYNSGNPGSPPPAPRPHVLTPEEQALRDSYQRSIQTDEASLRDLGVQREGFERRRAELRAKAKKLTDEQAKVNADLTGIAAGINKCFRWDPPAVDGVVTPARDFFPTTPTGPGDPAASSAPADLLDLGERDLKLAQLHIDNGKFDVARAKLERLIARFPDSPAARKARALLEAIKDK